MIARVATLWRGAARYGEPTDYVRRSSAPPVVISTVLSLSSSAIVATQSMVLPVLPELGNSMGVTLADASWMLTINMVAAAISTPLLSSLGDLLGCKPVLVVTLWLTTLGSVLVAVAPTIAFMLAGRALQGAGFAATPLAISIIRSIFPPKKVASSTAMLSSLTGIGVGAGLLVAGIMIKLGITAQHMFWIPAFITFLGLGGTCFFVRVANNATPLDIDIRGALALTSGLMCTIVAINRGSSWGWTSRRVLVLFLSGLVLLIVWVLTEQRARNPLVDIRLMRKPMVLATNITAFLTGAGMYGAFVLIVQFVQTPSAMGYGFGADALGAGLTLLPLTLGSVIAAGIVSVLINHVGPKWLMLTGTIVASTTFICLFFLHSEHWHFCLASGLIGFGLGLSRGVMPTLLNSDVGTDQTSVANGVNLTLRSIGGSIGTACVLTIIATRTGPGDAFPALDAYVTAFAASLGVCFLAVIAAALVPYRHRGENIGLLARSGTLRHSDRTRISPPDEV
ncbi:MFS transporter [Nocardia sp. SC052]|uniref:MFS transporter n=1 Tax=Nocardia sichangensis TaxID=3385975 RepID=UPI0039A0C9A0